MNRSLKIPIKSPAWEWLAAWFLFTAATLPLTAREIEWGGVLSADPLACRNSEGAALTPEYLCELGVFTQGFDPAAQPLSAWAANWHAAMRRPYQKVTAGQITLYRAGSHYANPDNAAPFVAGARGYIWVRNSRSAEAEWALVTAPSWLWPDAADPDPQEALWQFHSSGTLAIRGQINGAGFQLQTGRIAGATVPQLTYAAWRAACLDPVGASALQSAPGADYDGDGSPNVLEFAFGSVPFDAASRPPPVEAGRAGGFLTAMARRSAAALVTWVPESSSDLQSWLNDTVMVTESPDILTVRDHAAPGVAPRFLRFTLIPSP